MGWWMEKMDIEGDLVLIAMQRYNSSCISLNIYRSDNVIQQSININLAIKRGDKRVL
jgi:hypothetical protein